MANKVVENKILKLSLDDAALKKGLDNALGRIRNLSKSVSGIKSDGLNKLGNSASSLGSKFDGFLSKIPLIGKAAGSVGLIGDASIKAANKVEQLSASGSFSGLVSGAGSASSAILSVGRAATESANQLGIMDTALGVLAGNMLTRGADMAINFARQFTNGLRDGFREYETKMNSVQTIFSNTSSKGTTMDDITRALDELNAYADKTIYNFGHMTNAIGRFTAAGIDLDTSVISIQGMANAAAHAGASSEDMSRAMIQVSQALSAGVFQLMDWKSIENANMNTEALRNTLIKYGKAHGTITEDMIVDQNNFRESLSDMKWLTADVWNSAMAEYADANSELGRTATDAATKVKTFGQLVDTTKEAIGSGWAKTWELIFGDFEEARDKWTAIYNVVEGIINIISDGRNGIFAEWRNLGGYEKLWNGIFNILTSFNTIFNTIRTAFNNIFAEGSPVANMLFRLSEGFENLTKKMLPAENGFPRFYDIMTNLFSVADSLIRVFSALMSIIFIPFSSGVNVAGDGVDYFINLLGRLGFWLRLIADKVADWVEAAAVPIKQFLTPAFELIEMIATRVFSKLNTTLQKISSLAWEFYNKLIYKFDMAKTGQDAADGLTLFELAIRGVLKVITFLKNGLTFITNLANRLKFAFMGGNDVLSAFIEIVFTFADGTTNPIGKFLYDLAKGINSLGTEGFKATNRIQAFGRILGTILQFIKSKWDKVVSLISSWNTKDFMKSSNIGENVGVKFVKGFLIAIVALPALLVAGIVNGIGQLFPKVGDALNKAISKIFTSPTFKSLNLSELLFGPKVYAEEINGATKSMSKFDSRLKKNVKTLGAVNGYLVTVKETLVAFLSKFKLFDNFNKGFRGIADSSLLAKSKMAAFGNFISRKLKIDISAFDEFIKKSVETLKERFGSIPKFFSSISKGIGNVFSKLDFTSLTNFLKSISKIVLLYFDTITKVISKFSKPLGEFLSVFASFFKDIASGLEGTQLRDVGFLLLLWRFLEIMKSGTGITNGFLSSLTLLRVSIGGLNQAGTILGEIGKVINGYRKKQLSETILTFAKAILFVAASFVLLASVPTEKLIPTFFTLAGIIYLLAGAFLTIQLALNGINSKGGKESGVTGATNALTNLANTMGATEFKKLLKTLDKATMLTALASSLLFIGMFLEKVSKLSWDEIRNGLIAAGVAMLAMALTLKYATGNASLWDAAVVLGLALAVKMIGDSIAKIAAIDQKVLETGRWRIIQIMGILVVATVLINWSAQYSNVDSGLTIIGFVLLVFVIADAIKKVASINDKDLEKGIRVIGGLMAVLGGVMILMNLVGGKEIPVKNIFFMVGLVASVVVLAGAVALLSFFNQDKLTTSLGVVLGLFLVMAAAVGVLGSIKINGIPLSTIGFMVTITLMIIVLSATVALLGLIPQDIINRGTQLVGGVMIGFVAAIALLLLAMQQLGKPDMSAVGMIAVTAASIILLAGTVMRLSDYKFEEVLPALAVLGAILVAMGGILLAAQKSDWKSVAAIAVAAASIYIIAIGLTKLSGFNGDNLMASMISLGVVVGAMIAMIALSKGADVKGIVAMGVAALAVVGVAYSIGMLAQVQGDIIIAAACLGIIVAIMGLLMLAATAVDVTAIIGLVAAAGAILAIAFSMKMLSEISVGGLIIAIVALAAGLTLIVAAAVALLYTGAIAAVVGMGGSLIAFGAGALMFAIAVDIVVGALAKLWQLIVQIVTDVVNAIVFLAQGIIQGISMIPQILGQLWEGITTFFTEMPAKAFEWGANLISKFAEGIGSAVESVKEVAGNVWDSITGIFSSDDDGGKKDKKKPKDEGKKIPQEVAAGVTEGKPEVETAISGLGDGLNLNFDDLKISATDGAGGIISGFTDTFTNNAGGAQTGMDNFLGGAGISLDNFKTQIPELTSGLGDEFSMGLAGQATTAGTGMDEFLNGMDPSLTQFGTDMTTAGETGATNLQTGLSNKKESVATEAGNIATAAKEKVDGVDFSSSGGAWMDQLISGIEGKKQALLDTMDTTVGAARGFLPNSPAKYGPLSGSGWRKLAESGAAFINQWGKGMMGATGDISSKTSLFIGDIQSTLNEVANFAYDDLDISPRITPVLDMGALNEAKHFNITTPVNAENVRLQASYADMNGRLLQMQANQQNMDILANGLQIVSDKLGDLLEVTNDHTGLLAERVNVNTYMDGYKVNKHLAPGMLQAQQDYQDRINRLGGIIKPV